MYVLDGLVPVKVSASDPRVAALWADDDARTVAITEPGLSGDVVEAEEVAAKLTSGRLARVSTVFLVLDHNYFGSGPPILFETMVFGGPHHGYQARYCSAREALDGHVIACAKAGLKTEPKFGAIGRAVRKVRA